MLHPRIFHSFSDEICLNLQPKQQLVFPQETQAGNAGFVKQKDNYFRMRKSILFAIICLLILPIQAQNAVFVSASASNDDGDGATWETAKKTIAAGVTAAGASGTVFVKAGTYNTTAEFTIALMLACLRRLSMIDSRCKKGEWHSWTWRHDSYELRDKTIAIYKKCAEY